MLDISSPTIDFTNEERLQTVAIKNTSKQPIIFKVSSDMRIIGQN